MLKVACLTYYQIKTNPCLKVVEMCCALSLYNLDVTLISTSTDSHFRIKKYKYKNITIIEFPDLLWGKLRQGIDFFNTFLRSLHLIKNKYDIIHSIDCRPVNIIPAVLKKIIHKTPLLITWWDLFGDGGSATERSGRLYSLTFGKIESYFEFNFRKYADKSIVVTELLFNKLIDMRYPSSNIRKLYIGINKDNQQILSKGELRKFLNLSDTEKIFCFTGTLFKSDIDFFFDSLYELKKIINKLPVFLIIGNKNIKSIPDLNIYSLGILDSIETVYEYMTACDYGLVPMKTSLANLARWPSKVSDYLSAGLPIVTTPISDFKLVFSEYDLGYISPNDTSSEFANTIYKAICSNSENYLRKTEDVKRFVDERLDWRHVTNQINILYNESVM